MKRKNNFFTTITRHWDGILREVRTLLMQLFVLTWIVGMSGFAIFILMLWLEA